MAPQVTVFFHKLPTVGNNKAGHRVSFMLGHAPITRSMTKPRAAKENNIVKVVKTQIVKTPSKNALRNQRKRAARAQRKRDAQSNTIEAILAEIAQTTTIPRRKQKKRSQDSSCLLLQRQYKKRRASSRV